MPQDKTSRAHKILTALSQLLNVGNPFWDHTDTTSTESISGRAFRCGWRLEAVIDWFCGRGYCAEAHFDDIARAHRHLNQYPVRNLHRDQDL